MKNKKISSIHKEMNFPQTPIPYVPPKGMTTADIVGIVAAVLFIIAFMVMLGKCATTTPTPSYCFRG